MMPTQLQNYTGVLFLDNNENRAYLGQRNSAGEPIRSLMMIDTPPTGSFDPNGVLAAWRFFSNKPGVGNGSVITVCGFWGYPPSSDVPVLHVVRA